MTEVTITGIFEKVNNIFSLFKALLTPGKFQDSVLWQKEVLTILALGICLIAAISFISLNLISTLKKRQRNYKELVNALEEDGVELDYNLKPLVVDRNPANDLEPTLENQENSYNNDSQFGEYIEELASKLDDDTDSQNDLYDSHQIYGVSDTSVITPSPSKSEKKVFRLTKNHLTINDSKADNGAVKVISLSMANLKAEPPKSNKILNLDKDNLSQENIETLLDTSSVDNVPDSPDSNHHLITPTDVDSPLKGLNLIDNEDPENFELPDENYQVIENVDGETSIWDEVEDVVADIDSFKAEDEAEINRSQFNSDETTGEDETINENEPNDSIGLEAESILAEFSEDEAWNGHEGVLKELGEKQPHEESISSTNSTESRESTNGQLPENPKINGKKTYSNNKKTVEFLLDEDDSRHESNDFIAESKTCDIEDGLNNTALPLINDQNTKIISTELPLKTIDNKSTDSNLHESIAKLPVIDEQQNIASTDKIQNNFDQVRQKEHNATESNNIQPCSLDGEQMIENISIEDDESIEQNKINQLSIEFKLKSNNELQNSNVKTTSGINQPEIGKKGNKDQLSQKTIKRIIERLEFFQKNINKFF